MIELTTTIPAQRRLPFSATISIIFLSAFFFSSCATVPTLYRAAMTGDRELILGRIADGDDINALHDGWSPLMTAVKNSGDLEIIRLLVENGADINPVLDGRFSPLQLACYTGNEIVARYLIENGADVNADFLENPLSALYLAIIYCHESKTIQMLIDRGADLNFQMQQNGYTPLMQAIESGKLEMFYLLAAAGAEVHVETKSGSNLFLLACKYGNRELLQFLVDKGLNPKSKNDSGSNGFMHLAYSYSYTNKIFNPNSWNSDTSSLGTFLDLCEMDHGDSLVEWQIKMAQTYGLDYYEHNLFLRDISRIEEFSTYYQDVLDSKREENLKMIAFLDSHGVDFHDNNDKSVLLHAVLQNNRELALYLLDQGAQIPGESRLKLQNHALANQWYALAEALGADVSKRSWDNFILEEYTGPRDCILYIYREPAFRGMATPWKQLILNSKFAKSNGVDIDILSNQYVTVHLNAGPQIIMLGKASYTRFLRPNQSYFLRWNKDAIGFVTPTLALEEIGNNEKGGSFKL